MFRNHLKIAWRALWNQKAFSTINILGLAIGLATCLVITLFVKDELSYDRYNANADRIYRINAHFRINGDYLNERMVPAPLGPVLVKEVPEIEKFVRIIDMRNVFIKKGPDVVSESRACFADSTLFDVFTLPMLAGNPKTALVEPRSVVLAASMAKKYFAGKEANKIIGQTLTVNKIDYKVTGIIKDMPVQSHIHMDFFMAMSGNKSSRNDNWLDNPFVTYVLTRPGVRQETIDRDLKTVTRKYAEPEMIAAMNSSFNDLEKKGDYYNYVTIPLTRIHLYSDLVRESEPSGSIQYVHIFMAVALFLLLIACINYMNLSTAFSAGRSKEIGIRKVLGSSRSTLIAQFLTESIITSFIATALAILIVSLALPYFNHLSGKEITFGLFSSDWLFPSLVLFVIAVGLLAGIYPAIFLSAFRPIQTLKGKWVTGFKGSWLRDTLVIFQFAIAFLLIVSTLVIYRQLNFIKNKKLGYNREQVLLLKNAALLGAHAETFKDLALKIPGVESATLTAVLPTTTESNTDLYFKDATTGPGKSIALEGWYIDADYIPTLGMEMAKGRNFSPQRPTDSAAVLINETAASTLGYDDPLNNTLYQQGDNGKMVAHPIIGVVKDFNAGSLRNKIPSIVFTLSAEKANMAIRINAKNTPGIIAQLKDRYRNMQNMAGKPFEYTFLDEDFNKLYRSEQHTGNIFICFGVFAIFIACLGLFGLVTYAAERRTKEIGIRKVLGATVQNIARMLSKDFLKLVVIAAIVVFPIAWWCMNKWLRNFAYRTKIDWWIFALAGFAGIFIALITISFQSIRSAIANPIKSLRSE